MIDYLYNRIEVDQEQIKLTLYKRKKRIENELGLTKREKTFLILNATTLTYKQIAEIMYVEHKTIQTYYDRISKKLNLRSRQSLTIFSLQNGLATIANYE